MTLTTLWGKLRKHNKEDYRQFRFGILFAMSLISSFLILVCSPLIQGALPDGGDSAKQIYLIFGVAAVGCIIFIMYINKLFLRYKSREIGIFMALGTEKHTLARAVAVELGKMTVKNAVCGILIGGAVSFLLGKGMEIIVAEVYDGKFAFSIGGIVYSALYAAVLFLIIEIQARQAMRRTNIMEVINEQRKQEPMKKAVSRTYMIQGLIMTILGFAGAVFLPGIAVYGFGVFLGAWTNVFYLAAVAGVYRLLVYAVSSHQKGRNPQKYYNNLIDYGMMKFQGASVVRNMLVITLLIFGGMYAIAYLPMNMVSSSSGLHYESDMSYRWLNDAAEPSEEEIRQAAQKHSVEVENYREGRFVRVFGSGIERDMGDDNKLKEDYYDQFALFDVTSVSEYEKLTGISLEIPQGGYYQIIGETSYENVWAHFGDMDQLYIESEQEYLPMKYMGNTIYESLNICGTRTGMGDEARFVVSDADFERLSVGLEASRQETQVLYDVTGSTRDEIAFSNEIYKRYAKGMSEDMNVLGYYNAATAKREGADYADMEADAVVDPDNPLKETDWQYCPVLKPIINQQAFMLLASRMVLFAYIFVICLAAVGVIGYTRSQGVGLSNAQVFEDIKRLGADKAYRTTLMKRQLRKVFVLPTVLGVVLCLAYQVMIMWSNDNKLASTEVYTVIILAGIGLLIAGYQYLVYKGAVKKVRTMLKLG